MRVLLIDDSRAVRSHVRRMLTSMGATCTEAGDGKDALERLENDGPFDLALVDYVMPELDGPGFLRAIQDMSHASSMKKLMVTSMTSHEHVMTALECGADDYLMKPFTPDVLVEKLRLLDFECELPNQ